MSQKEILANVFNIPLSEGTITSMVSRCAGKLSDVLSKIDRLVICSDVNNADETGFRVEGKLQWAHVLCNGYKEHPQGSLRRHLHNPDQSIFFQHAARRIHAALDQAAQRSRYKKTLEEWSWGYP